ncbi:hypothetical protein ACUY29_11630 [Corynebacterium aurimucosum]
MEKLTRNPETDLFEEPNHFMGLPLVHQRSLSSMKFRTRLQAAHTIPLENGHTLDFLSRLKSAEALYVVFHGAIAPDKLYYPRFERESSLRKLQAASLHFADPTLLHSKDRSMRLSWYLGGPGWDPILEIAHVVRTAMRQMGTENVAFLGGSGGGFAALRISALSPGSLAFVQDPQTEVMRYYTGAVRRYFDTMWPGQNRATLVQQFPDRFDVNHLYAHYIPNNFVYYYQGITDDFHRKGHYNPFLAAIGCKEGGRSYDTPNRKMVLAHGEIEGHGKITPQEFETHFELATKWWLGTKYQM